MSKRLKAFDELACRAWRQPHFHGFRVPVPGMTTVHQFQVQVHVQAEVELQLDGRVGVRS